VSQLNVNTISPQSGSNIKITGTISGSNMNLSGDVTAQRFVVSSSITKLVTITNSGSTAFGDSLDDTHIYTGSLQLTGSLTTQGDIIATSGNISGSITSTGSFGHIMKGGINFDTAVSSSAAAAGFGGGGGAITALNNKAANRLVTIGSTTTELDGEANLTFDGTILSGSATSTGSFGSVETAGNITIPATNKIFLDDGGDTYIQESSGNVVDFYVGGFNALKVSAQSVEIPRYFAHMGDTNNYIDFGTDTQTFVTDGGNTLELLSNHNVVASQGDIIATSGNISGSATSTGSFGRVEATTIGGNSPLTIESDNFNVKSDGTISGSANSTASFGKGRFDRTVAIGDQALNAIGNYTLWVEDHDNGHGIYATDQSFFDNMKIYNNFFLNEESAYATIKISANNRGLLLDASYGGGYTGDIFHRATGHRFFPRGSVTKGQELFVITGSHFQSSSVMLSGSAASTGSFGIIENNTQIAGFRPIINQTADFSASLSNAGRYHIVHGNITCSIGTDSDMPVTIGAEYEFFQSSSVGNFLFQTGSGVSLFSKNDNRNIAGQYSGATLKKVAANTFHLVGDLT
tara:strand:+ start:2309 stop:4036 length:1728 start_codon:yes stop_codon:yes gene_type:complete